MLFCGGRKGKGCCPGGVVATLTELGRSVLYLAEECVSVLGGGLEGVRKTGQKLCQECAISERASRGLGRRRVEPRRKYKEG